MSLAHIRSDMRRKGIGDMAAAGRDVERAPAFLRRGQRHHALQALAERVRFAGEVAGGGLAELLLDEGLAHDGFRKRAGRSTLIADRHGPRYRGQRRGQLSKRHKSAGLVVAAAQHRRNHAGPE